MRKIHKQQALEYVSVWKEAHDEIKRNLEAGQIENVLTILADCQEGAIQLGDYIEKLAGEGTRTIELLEKYCEILFQKYNEVQEEVTHDSYKVTKHLEKQRIKIENSIRNDIVERKEIVFFPYKASMWDSLESVYLALKEDGNCDVYCVPIPYYDRNPNGSLGLMHYEGGEYPKNIEVIDWRSYDLKERRPDVVYIHNPYDEYNRVTCVHEDYFARNLKKYTEELVYIPYFVLGEIDPSDQETIDKIKSFCYLPGTIYADKVILQSENMRQIYINEYIKAAKTLGRVYDREQLEKKFLGTGSPKIDKVKNVKLENIDIPEEWIKIIKKSDGTWKKIVLYNTSVVSMTQHREEMLKKIKNVLLTFKREKNEIALLWRPHPLFESTIKSMFPHLWEEYREIVEQYRTEGWGIYDDTADLNRAIAISDGYYGDMSSVVHLYQETGKPAMIQNVDIR